MTHPLNQFVFCPVCGAKTFVEHNEKSKECTSCGFVYYYNPSAAVACFIRNRKGELLLVRRAKEPAMGTLDLPGGFVDMHESAEDAVRREVKEETGLEVGKPYYLFSVPNKYMFSNFEVQTLDLFFECYVDNFDNAVAADDASVLVVRTEQTLRPKQFGLESIKEALVLYHLMNTRQQ